MPFRLDARQCRLHPERVTQSGREAPHLPEFRTKMLLSTLHSFAAQHGSSSLRRSAFDAQARAHAKCLESGPAPIGRRLASSRSGWRHGHPHPWQSIHECRLSILGHAQVHLPKARCISCEAGVRRLCLQFCDKPMNFVPKEPRALRKRLQRRDVFPIAL